MFRGVSLALLVLTLFCGQALAAEKYTVASDCTWPPMEMLNAQKQPEGYSTDYIRAVAKAAWRVRFWIAPVWTTTRSAPIHRATRQAARTYPAVLAWLSGSGLAGLTK